METRRISVQRLTFISRRPLAEVLAKLESKNWRSRYDIMASCLVTYEDADALEAVRDLDHKV